jgi:hypothetical protein
MTCRSLHKACKMDCHSVPSPQLLLDLFISYTYIYIYIYTYTYIYRKKFHFWPSLNLVLTIELRNRKSLTIQFSKLTHQTGDRPFKFERGWLLRDGFYDMVANIQQSETKGSTPLIERWQAKIRRLRQHLRGWDKHTAGSYRKEKRCYYLF